ncbi:MAG: type II secretion system F family protein [bacterium]
MKNKNNEISNWVAPFLYFGLKNQAFNFVENISYFLSAGMSLAMALSSMEAEMSGFRMKRLCKRMQGDIQDGFSLSQSFERQKFFSANVIALVRAGEITGKLAENMRLVALLNDEDQKLKSKLNSSLLYGTIILVLTVVVGVGTAWFVLPVISDVYSKIGEDLPLITRVLISGGTFLVNYGAIFLPIAFAFLVAFLYFIFSFPKTKFIGHLLLFHVPLVKKLIKESEITRFGYILGNMLNSGLPINEALATMPNTTTFKNYQKLYLHLESKILEGFSFYDSLKSYGKINSLFPGNVLQMISSAERSGKLSETLLRISGLYATKVENTSRNLPIILEPIILIFVGLGVALFVLATIMPIYNLSNIIK